MYALVVGEALVDIVVRPGEEPVELPGGSAANAAVALARLGKDVRFLTAYADDDRGRALADHIGGADVTDAADPHVLERTPSATASIGPTGAATYEFDVTWDLRDLPSTDDARFVHLCSWAPVLEPGASKVLGLLEATTAPVTYDINLRPGVTGSGPALTAAVERAVRHTWLVKASDEDLETLYPDADLNEAVARLRALGPTAVVVTQGGDGATWHGAETVHVASEKVDVADTIGAGDTFGAGLLAALWDAAPDTLTSAQVEEALRYASRAAAVTVSRPGADPPYATEL